MVMQETEREETPDPEHAATRLTIYVLCSFMATVVIGWLSGVPITGRIWILAAMMLVLWPVLCVILLSVLLVFIGILLMFDPAQISEDGRSEFGRMKNEFVSFLFSYYQPERFLTLKAILLGLLLGISLLYARYAIEIPPGNQ